MTSTNRNSGKYHRRTFLGQMTVAGAGTVGASSLLGSGSGNRNSARGAEEMGAAEGTELAPPPNPAILHPGVWAFDLPKNWIILVCDEQLETLVDPDAKVNLSLSAEPNVTTLREVCENAQKLGAKTLIFAFDEFWTAYRTDVPRGKPRQLYPDSDRYIELVATISRFAAGYGLGLELSLLSPLEIGKRFAEVTGASGGWVQYREGYRDKISGQFSVSLWEQKRWGNNKGTILLERQKVRVFAFRERGRFGADPYYTVFPHEIVELSGPFDLTEEPSANAEDTRPQTRLTVTGRGNANAQNADLADYERVMVLVTYKTPEIDYFSPLARPFLHELVKKYHEAGVVLNALYSDEIHIQQDWHYFGHHESGQFALRYLTDSFAETFAAKYGEEFRDFEKYLVYFLVGQHDFLPTTEATECSQHVPSPDDAGIQFSWLLRRRYFDLLHQTVVDLFAGAKKEAERLYGKRLEARAHATWAQSPTIDRWRTPGFANHYEYTPDFVWSNTVHQAAAACDDYFRWNDFLTGGGNDHAEGGWLDRNYYGEAIACSAGSLNDEPNAYAAAWGMPDAVNARHSAISSVFGCAPGIELKSVEDGVHREVEVLMLYPIALVACQERFGSWMSQYAYANSITGEKLLQYGTLREDGAVEVRGRTYQTICAQYEPILQPGLIDFLERFVSRGGRLVWTGPPALVDLNGEALFDQWRRLFGIEGLQTGGTGKSFPGRIIEFSGTLSGIEPMTILTDFPVDAVYPFRLAPEAVGSVEQVATCAGELVGVRKNNAVYLGFRPRDDQSASLGYETRVWFETLQRLGAYPPSDVAPDGINDNPSVISRTGNLLTTRFPNGTIAVTNHFCRYVEDWPGGFHRDADADAEILRARPLPPDDLRLEKFPLAGRTLDYAGNYLVAVRPGKGGEPIAFYGHNTDKIGIDGGMFSFADKPVGRIAWGPVLAERRVAGGATLEIWVAGDGATIRIPLAEPIDAGRLFHRRGQAECGEEIPATVTDGILEFTVPAGSFTFFFVPK